MRCQSDDCELVHCRKCGCHTVGNTLTHSGLCQDCQNIEDDAYEIEMRRRYHNELLKKQ